MAMISTFDETKIKKEQDVDPIYCKYTDHEHIIMKWKDSKIVIIEKKNV